MLDTILYTLKKNGLPVHGIQIVQHGRTLLSHHAAPDIRYPVYSAAKSILCAAAGIAADAGLLSPDAPLADFLEQKYLSAMPAPQRDTFRRLPLRRFLTMSVPGYPFRPAGNDWLADALALPVDYTAQPSFHYSNIPAYLTGIACANAAGMHLIDYLTPRLFEPLGIENPPFQNDPQGRFYGATGMQLTLDELSRFGQLLLQNGVYDGKRLISEKWVREASALQIPNDRCGYGYFLWRSAADGFYISGKWGQLCLILPQKQLVITCLADLPDRAEQLRQTIEAIAVQI